MFKQGLHWIWQHRGWLKLTYINGGGRGGGVQTYLTCSLSPSQHHPFSLIHTTNFPHLNHHIQCSYLLTYRVRAIYRVFLQTMICLGRTKREDRLFGAVIWKRGLADKIPLASAALRSVALVLQLLTLSATESKGHDKYCQVTSQPNFA